jgi:tetratricopeptide (TPR) repeat protein
VAIDWQTVVPRTRQLVRLNGFLARALDGEGTACFLTGEAGAGKTTLMHEFVRGAQEAHRDLLVTFGDCNQRTGAGDPYLPFREIFAQLAGEVAASGSDVRILEENARRLSGFVEVAREVILDLGADLMGIFLPGASLLAHLGGKLFSGARGAAGSPGSREQIVERYTEVLRQLSLHRPLILLIDDLQWADAASLDLLFHLVRRVQDSRLLIIGSYRPEEVAAGRGGEPHPLVQTLTELRRYYGDVLIEMRDTDRNDQRRFVDALLASEPNRLDDAFRDALLRHTEGHPLFTVELLRSFAEQGFLAPDEQGNLTLAGGLVWDDLPSRVEGVIEARIGRMDTELRDIATISAIQGDTFIGEVTARVLTANARAVIQRLSRDLDKQHQLVAAQGVDRIGENRLSWYQFRHNLFQVYLYGSLNEAERSYMHEDVGTVLEAVYGDRAPEIAVHLAEHFAQAGDDDRASLYQVHAGAAAEAVYAYAEAMVHYANALRGLGRLPPSESVKRRRVDATVSLAKVSYLGESPGQNMAYLKQAEPLAAELRAEDGSERPDALRLAKVHYWMGRYYFMLHDPQKAIEYYKKVVEVGPSLDDPELLALPPSVIGRALVSQGQFEQAIPLLSQALDPLEQTGNVIEWIHTLNFLANAKAGCGFAEEGIRHASTAMARAREIESSTAVSLSHIHGWIVLMHAGRQEGMLDAAALTVEAAEATGDPVPLYVGLGFLAWSECRNGQYERAARTMERCREVANRLGGGPLVIADWLAAVEAEIALGVGEPGVAAELAERAVETARRSEGVLGLAMAHRTWARALSQSGATWSEVEKHLGASLDAGTRGGMRPELARTHLVWSDLAARVGHQEIADEHRGAALQIVQEGVGVQDVARVLQ